MKRPALTGRRVTGIPHRTLRMRQSPLVRPKCEAESLRTGSAALLLSEQWLTAVSDDLGRPDWVDPTVVMPA